MISLYKSFEKVGYLARFPSRPFIIRVPFFLLFGFNRGTQKEKG